MNILKRVAIFAINSPDQEESVEEYLTLKKINYKRVQGSYKGNLEDSFVAIVDEDYKLDVIFSLAARFNQESILVVNEDRKAELHDVLTGDVTLAGDFRAVDALDAKDLDGWTLDGTTYYGIV